MVNARELLVAQKLLLERQKDDPLTLFQPSPKQAAFITSVLEGHKAENWFVAANRAGKSDAGAYVGAKLARFGDQSPGVKYVGAKGSNIEVRDRATSGWVVSLDFPSSRDIIQPKYFDNGFVPPGSSHRPFIPEHEIRKDGWNKSDQILRLKNGSIIGFKSADSGRIKFQGTEKNWIQFDEEPPYDIYQECVIRVGSMVLKVFGTCTLLPPEGQVGGVSWLYSEILQPWLQGKKNEIGCFSASIYDNPHIPISEITRLERLYAEGSSARRIRLNGEWLPGLGGSRAYTSFQRGLHVVVQPPIVAARPLCWMWDFNVEPMVSLVGQREGRVFRIYQEMILEEGSIPEMVDWFKKDYPAHPNEIWIYGDASGNGRTAQTGKSDYALIQNHMKGYSSPLRLKVPEANPGVPDRVNAVNNSFMNESGEIMAYIDVSCNELITDFEQVLRDPRSGIKKTTKKTDPYFRRTHTSDAYGYWVSREEPVKLEANQKQNQHMPVTIRRPAYRR